MGFFNTVQYTGNLPQVDSKYETLERIADVCRRPAMWFAELWDGGKTVLIHLPRDHAEKVIITHQRVSYECAAMKVARIMVGILLTLPAVLLGALFMGLAYCSEEVQLKHKISNSPELAGTETARLRELINERVTRQK
jgi:hypothetical protein